MSHGILMPCYHFLNTGFFKTLDTDLDGVVTFDLSKVGISLGVGEGTRGGGSREFLPCWDWSLWPQNQPQRLGPESREDGVGCLSSGKGRGREGQAPGGLCRSQQPGLPRGRQGKTLSRPRGSLSHLPSEGLKRWWLLSQEAGRLDLGVVLDLGVALPLADPSHPSSPLGSGCS